MNVYSAIQRRRTIRRFKDQSVPDSVLFKLVDVARLAPSAGNLQPLEYITVSSKKGCDALFPHLKWSKLIKNGEPPDGRKPVGYVIVLINRDIVSRGGAHDVGAAVQNMLLATIDEGFGSCWLRSIDRSEIKATFKIPDNCEIDSVIAIGKPAESPLSEVAKDSTAYWRDDRGLMHVPKRKVDHIIHREKY